ncbi:hypothetical protein MKW92_030631 [Papaver armeniacum]|nr:hypothetical protein MKW92_030631 [Papaver armeniacum]
MEDLLPDSRPWALFEAKGWTDGSSDSKSLRSTDVSDPSLDGSKSLRSRVVPARSADKPRKERKFTTKELDDFVRPYAMDAISVYNERAGTKYELVEPGNFTNVLLPRRLLHHIDFTAKKTDVADAPVEMFFAELITVNEGRSVECCRCMGPKESISGDKNNGCCYCMNYNVQHPRDGGFMAGCYGLFSDEGYFSDE